MKLGRKPTQVLWHNGHRHGNLTEFISSITATIRPSIASCKQARALVSMCYMEWGSQWSMYLTLPRCYWSCFSVEIVWVISFTKCCAAAWAMGGSASWYYGYGTEFQLWPELNLPLLVSTCSLFCLRMVSKCAHKAEPWRVDLRKWDPTFVLEHHAKFLEPNGHTHPFYHQKSTSSGHILHPPTSQKKNVLLLVFLPGFSTPSFKPRRVEQRTDDQRASAKLSVPRLLKELANTGPRRVL